MARIAAIEAQVAKIERDIGLSDARNALAVEESLLAGCFRDRDEGITDAILAMRAKHPDLVVAVDAARSNLEAVKGAADEATRIADEAGAEWKRLEQVFVESGNDADWPAASMAKDNACRLEALARHAANKIPPVESALAAADAALAKAVAADIAARASTDAYMQRVLPKVAAFVRARLDLEQLAREIRAEGDAQNAECARFPKCGHTPVDREFGVTLARLVSFVALGTLPEAPRGRRRFNPNLPPALAAALEREISLPVPGAPVGLEPIAIDRSNVSLAPMIRSALDAAGMTDVPIPSPHEDAVARMWRESAERDRKARVGA